MADSPTRDEPSFAETALRMGGKSEEEARRVGAVDKADEQVEALFARRYQTAQSPVHRAVWEPRVPLELFDPPAPAASAPCDAAMERAMEIMRRRRDAGTVYDADGKISAETVAELAGAGFWGMLIDPAYGGQGAPFARFARFYTRLTVLNDPVAGMASVHGCIGAVDPIRTFGTPEQKARFLPRLASGQALSAFALTEPGAGSDLTALRTTAREVGDELEITGEKLFITHALPGRTIGLVVVLNGRPAVVIAELPGREDEHFQLVRYGLHALPHATNNGLRFRGFRVPRANLLVPSQGDGLTIAYHGLNLGRVTLCAGAAGNMRALLAGMLPWAEYRRTYGRPIAARELVRRRIARLAGLIAGADALSAWCSWLIDEGYRGELECIVAKIFGSEALKEAAVELAMKTHGGRSFLRGHPVGDNLYDLLAPCIYEGEGEMLGMAFFKSLVKEHGRRYYEPLGRRAAACGIGAFRPWRPDQLWALRRELGAYAGWWLRRRLAGGTPPPVSPPAGPLDEHVAFALERLGAAPDELDATMRRHQLGLADRQCRMAELSQRVQDVVVMLVTALWGRRQTSEASAAAAQMLCRDLRRKLTGERADDAYFEAADRLGELILSGGFEALAGVPRGEILMQYANP
jgi:alkylation response protein AidB-like acyl-CoA dehydrogenase